MTLITTPEQFKDQVTAAQSAYETSRQISPQQRAEWLNAIAKALGHHADELIELARKETHLDIARLQGEMKRTIFQLQLFAKEIQYGLHFEATIDHTDANWGMGARPDIRRMNVALGVVGVFGASNFPFAFSVMGGDSVSALAAGCAVIHKVHDAHLTLGLRTGEVVVEALKKVGAPDGLFSVIHGREAAEALVDHPLIQAIGFTGSLAGGRALYDRASRRTNPIPFFGELGSINPVFVTEKAWKIRQNDILTGYANAATMGMGQFCTKPGLLFVPRFEKDAVLPLLQQEFSTKKFAPLLSPNLRKGFEAALSKVSAIANVDVLIEGNGAEAPSPTILCTTVSAIKAKPEILELEMFGPASVMVQYDDESELAEIVALLEGQLTCTLQAEADENLSSFVDAVHEKCGRILWNGWPTGVTVSYAQHHGGPYPSTTSSARTSVGTGAIGRFMRAVAYQTFPDVMLPPALQENNPWKIIRRIDGLLAHS
ncbi:aldehyde dehydrogenase (NADP(+)) [Acinetobacter sp. S40]|uniref:aldehyde dehydrogenase (NADP(+)) n=1 Tax=Acinetobacter sp. S40 TaxID=2767434 RepID=UPI00190D5AEE|nr:aldehyde dehydrogenase (NADP(+)) [Acinetobacter sp. S40]MBJ9985856.1 aldehyde dehydrogenase (NADP(+)) [Acinetobacter sp. S40]